MMKFLNNIFTVLPTSVIKVGLDHLKKDIGGWSLFRYGLGSLRAGLRGSFGAGSSVIQYSTESKSSFNAKFIKPHEDNCFLDEDTNIEYTRTFAKWKCLNCHKKWYSAFSWISLTFAENNQKTCRDSVKIFDSSSQKRINKTNIVFDGSSLQLKNYEFLPQNCKNCLMMDKVKIISYSNLAKPSGEVDDSFKPHRKDLCAKCLKGKPCTAA
jgi:hypothetical protein